LRIKTKFVTLQRIQIKFIYQMPRGANFIIMYLVYEQGNDKPVGCLAKDAATHLPFFKELSEALNIEPSNGFDVMGAATRHPESFVCPTRHILQKIGGIASYGDETKELKILGFKGDVITHTINNIVATPYIYVDPKDGKFHKVRGWDYSNPKTVTID
jgi:hypothetical protein